MQAIIETYAQQIVIVLPLASSVMSGSHVAQIVLDSQLEQALAYYLPKISEITLDVFVERSDVVAQLPAEKIVARRNGFTRQAL